MDAVTGQSWADQMVYPSAHQTGNYLVFLTGERMVPETEPQMGRRWAGESGKLMVPEMVRSWAHQMECLKMLQTVQYSAAPTGEWTVL
jgi:hypothetical protein